MDYSVKELIDDAFYVEKCAWGTWKSYDNNGKPLVTSLTSENCIAATRSYLKWQQDGSLNDTGVSYSSVVDGKL